MNLEQKIEAILFYKGEPMAETELVHIFRESSEAISEALGKLESSLTERGVRLVRNGKEVELRTASEASGMLEELRKEELSKDLGKAAVETLAIVLYRGPISRSEIDYIRGVNSSFILRSLMIRGLVEREANEKDQRSFLYRPTIELLSHLGVSKVEDLPDYQSVGEGVKALITEEETS
ncbi:MAG TPA: SMC-Scp complex subunit ScpB [Candidatus Paceibacterota bacterium]